MPPTPPAAEMGRKHEEHLAEALGGWRTKNSGATPTDKGDGAHHHDDPFAFRWDAKSTKAASIQVTLAMIKKIREQAGGERPAIPLRWYGNAMLTQVVEDWIALRLDDFTELLEAARQWAAAEAEWGDPGEALAKMVNLVEAVAHKDDAIRDLSAALDRVTGERDRLRRQLTRLQAQTHQVKPSPEHAGNHVPGIIPQLPWTSVYAVHTSGTVKHSGVHYDAAGYLSTFHVASVRVERSLGSSNRPRLVVNDVRVPFGDLFVDGRLRTRVWAGNSPAEVG